jgi:hypothetical protein
MEFFFGDSGQSATRINPKQAKNAIHFQSSSAFSSITGITATATNPITSVHIHDADGDNMNTD